jgi:electron transfer flavoprotein alpha subunit
MQAFILAQHPEQAASLAGGARAFVEKVSVFAFDNDLANTPADVIFRIAVPAEAMLEDAAQTIAALLEREQSGVVFCEPTRQIRLLVGKIAALIGVSAQSDILSFAADGTVEHLVYGGAAVRKEKAITPLQLIFAPCGSLPEWEPGGERVEVELDWIAPVVAPVLKSTKARERAAVDLTAARRVVGIGRGIGQETAMAMVQAFASVLDAEVGCTRPIAEEEKWLPRDAYIGVSGAMLAPDVYVAVGISGQVQHTVGISRAKTIVAINKDRNAPIFKQADYGIVGDLYKIVPELTAKLGG